LPSVAGCAAILQQIAACRGAIDGLIAEVVEDHIRELVIGPRLPRYHARVRAVEKLVEIVHSFLGPESDIAAQGIAMRIVHPIGIAPCAEDEAICELNHDLLRPERSRAGRKPHD